MKPRRTDPSLASSFHGEATNSTFYGGPCAWSPLILTVLLQFLFSSGAAGSLVNEIHSTSAVNEPPSGAGSTSPGSSVNEAPSSSVNRTRSVPRAALAESK